MRDSLTALILFSFMVSLTRLRLVYHMLAFAVGIPLGSAQSGRSPHPAFRPTTFGQRAGVAIVPDYLRVAVAA
ncbi:hypothetical protein AnigIFM49718_005130, partial [Aspergillus niger]